VQNEGKFFAALLPWRAFAPGNELGKIVNLAPGVLNATGQICRADS